MSTPSYKDQVTDDEYSAALAEVCGELAIEMRARNAEYRIKINKVRGEIHRCKQARQTLLKELEELRAELALYK